jgi:hypothetical protein
MTYNWRAQRPISRLRKLRRYQIIGTYLVVNFILKFPAYIRTGQEDINHLNRSITPNEIEAAVKSLPKKEKSRT